MTRTSARIATTLLLMALPALAGGCATGGANGGGEGGTTVVVENDLVPPTALSVYAVSGLGTRTLVGHVSPGSTETLRFRASPGSREYRFVAETTAGRELVSNPLTFAAGATLRWDLNSNVATVRDPGSD